jgi:hypothetical protein
MDQFPSHKPKPDPATRPGQKRSGWSQLKLILLKGHSGGRPLPRFSHFTLNGHAARFQAALFSASSSL